jgi:dipeptidyl-peptidase-4
MRLEPSIRVLLVSLLAISALNAQSSRTSELVDRIDQIFKERRYSAPRFGPARWMPDGVAYAIVEAAAGGGSEIVRYDAATGNRSVLVGSKRLVPTGAKEPLEIEDYAWSSDGKRLLIFTNTQKVWRDNTRGDYWVLDVASGALKKIGVSAPESSLMFAKFSPDSTRVGYVQGNNIYVEQLSDGKTLQLTRDGSETTINGTSDWVYEEELFLRDCFRWSPDGKNIAYWQFDTTGVGIYTLVDDTTNLYPSVRRYPYPKVGTTNSAVRIGVVPANGGKTRWLKTPGEPRNSYLATLDWVDANTVAIQQLNRLQNRNDFLIGDVRNGNVSVAFRDESKTWVEFTPEVPWIDEGRAYLWVSERDGWRHIYRVPRPPAAATSNGNGAAPAAEPTLITRFDGDVIDVSGVDETSKTIYFRASPQSAIERYLYRAPLDGSKPPERVTPADRAGSHVYELAPGGRLAFHTASAFDRPPRMDVVELPSHRSLRALTDTSALEKKLEPLLRSKLEFFTIDIGGGVALDAWMIKPPTFSETRKYPTIVYVYGEPFGLTVTNSWSSSNGLFHRALAEAGYIVVSFENRGTPAPKGAAWRKIVYGSVGDLSSKDQAAAIRALAAKHAFIDSRRIGIWGWSGGGTNTLNAMFRFPDVYAVGAAVAPVPDQKLYDTIYQERYMGLPAENAEGYRVGSAINFAEGLKGKLLVVHGSGDDNVHYQGTERLVNKLVALGKPFDLMVYPNRTHSISEGPGTTPHIYQLIARYFVEHLPPDVKTRE